MEDGWSEMPGDGRWKVGPWLSHSVVEWRCDGGTCRRWNGAKMQWKSITERAGELLWLGLYSFISGIDWWSEMMVSGGLWYGGSRLLHFDFSFFKSFSAGGLAMDQWSSAMDLPPRF